MFFFTKSFSSTFYTMTVLLSFVCANVCASNKESRQLSTLQDVKKAVKYVLPYTPIFYASALALEYRRAKKNNEFPRLNKKRMGRAMVQTGLPGIFAAFVAYQFEKYRYNQ